MVDDRRSGKLEQAREAAQPARSRFNPLRLTIIIFILLIGVLVGLHFKLQANPGAEPSTFAEQPPQYINVYETNYQIPISVTVTFGQEWLVNYGRYVSPIELPAHGYADFSENVEVTATPTGSAMPGTIVITSTTRPLPNGGEPIRTPVFRLRNGPGPIAAAMKFAVAVQLFRNQDNTWSGSAFFASIPIVFQDNGSTFGHLPSVGAYEVTRPPSVFLQAQYDHGKLENVISLLGGPTQIPVGDSAQDLGDPSNISYTEDIENIVPTLKSEQIDYSIPAINNGSDIDYTWYSNGISGLQPIFKATNPDAIDSQNQAAFYSGIAFGIAAAAAIALVQEIPESRKRESRTSNA
jgi:hypothetical protein